MRIFFIAFIALCLCGCDTDKSLVTVKYVIYGDTFASTSYATIRIWGIDTPEKREPYYETAKQYLKNLIEGETLDCNLIDVDRYQRDVMRCYLNGKDISIGIVREGLARDYKRYSNGYYQREETAARKDKLGIWSD